MGAVAVLEAEIGEVEEQIAMLASSGGVVLDAASAIAELEERARVLRVELIPAKVAERRAELELAAEEELRLLREGLEAEARTVGVLR